MAVAERVYQVLHRVRFDGTIGRQGSQVEPTGESLDEVRALSGHEAGGLMSSSRDEDGTEEQVAERAQFGVWSRGVFFSLGEPAPDWG